MLHFCPLSFPRWAGILASLGLLTGAKLAHAQTPASFAPVSTYTAASSYDNGRRSLPWAVADMNGDGLPDIVTANTNDLAGVFLGLAGGALPPSAPIRPALVVAPLTWPWPT